jgi:hypothetical protein
MTAYDFEGNDWDEITESEKRSIVDRLVAERDALSDDYETLVAEHDNCSTALATGPGLDVERWHRAFAAANIAGAGRVIAEYNRLTPTEPSDD